MAETSSMRRDIASAYLASGAKIVSWVIVSAMVYRAGGAEVFGLLVLIRGTLGILNYLTLGLGPALVKLMAEVIARPQGREIQSNASPVLSYAQGERHTPLRTLYSTAINLAFFWSALGLVLTVAYALAFEQLHKVPEGMTKAAGIAACFIGMGLLVRLISEPSGAVLQTSGRISRDNHLVLEAEVLWLVGSALLVLTRIPRAPLLAPALAFAVAGVWLLFRRAIEAERIAGRPYWVVEPSIKNQLLRVGGLITLAQVADYLYAPAGYILINHFLGAGQVAIYAPAVQIDAALLVLVSGMAAVLFPRSAIAHAAGDVAAVKKYYLRGTLASAGILVGAGLVVWLISPLLFRIWLGNPMPDTQEILPLVLIHTVIGASSMVGRSVLLATGKFAPFAISVLMAGVMNVVLGFVFVKYLGWGLKGIVMGTIVAVVLRCVVWMPWYVMRSLREVREAPVEVVEAPMV